ncbi:DUF4031 domain-containing protein [Dactylosporangium sucinum]|uniref:DUF4031 domain-containing protein n=1 Tax=Dactylosporangium sucinum TaxID=1424081 RepID=A0A917TGY9_9ACTN|nr:DUF4031 domain-containing protein [Dactylosporangium sucinum]GGM22790.1 hypothetical protein GCM10007977_024990 [Dactylosporangium sucinum]
MTVYVDSANIPARVGRREATWCHLTADTQDELHAFARRLGLQRRWFQTCKYSKACQPAERCVHWHYDVTAPKRAQAVALGAVEIDRHRLVELLASRRAALNIARGQDVHRGEE